MHTGRSRVAVLAMVLAVAGVIPTNAQAPQALQKAKAFQRAVTLPAAGTFDGGGTFAGTATINRFELRGNQIVAIGLVTGVLSRGGVPLGSAVVGEVTWPVALRTGGQVLAAGRVRELGTPSQIAWSPDAGSSLRMFTVQAEACQVVDLALAPITLDVLGLQVSLSPITFNLQGVAGTPLGDLVCAVSDLLGNVAAVVNLLNNILGLLTGLLGGLTGGLG